MGTAFEELAAAEDACCTPAERPVLADVEAARFASTFKALADPTRVKIVRLLADAGELCVCDINTNFELEDSTMSHHLKVLREAGLLAADKRGLWVFYRLIPETLAMVRQFAP
ncbi:MAG TPA: metalloregulator ArsR/SmtB family transcription factor [Chloroflexota bacterium]|nr:metalloregulator ArsR/SmtB family transcription factor [Chloroflexota bacterium]